MILYRPTDGDVHTSPIQWRPRTCFVMAQLGPPIPPKLQDARSDFEQVLDRFDYKQIDADAVTTGQDFLLKIWGLTISVPVGIAFVHEGINSKTLANIFYELGMMQVYGKEILIIKVGDADIPSDFVRTEYVSYDGHFDRRISTFFSRLEERAEYYLTLADQLERNPLLAIDYVRRAYLLSGDNALITEAQRIFNEAGLADRAKNSVEQLLLSFCHPFRERGRTRRKPST